MKKKKVLVITSVAVATVIGLGALGSAVNASSHQTKGEYATTEAFSAEAWSETTVADYSEEECYEYDAWDAGGMKFADEVNGSAILNEEVAMEANSGEGSLASSDFTWNQEGSENATSKETVSSEGRKMIKTVNMTVETLNFDEYLQGIQDRTYAYGGYIQELETWNNSRYSKKNRTRDAYLVIKVPSEDLEKFLNEVGNNGNVIERSEAVNDVTSTYTDYESRKNVLKTEEERLLSFMSEATTVEDIMDIEARLTEVQAEIDRIESSLRTYDNLIAYSTVKIQLNEVVEFTEVVEEPTKEPTFADNMKEHFLNSVYQIIAGAKAVAYWFAGSIIYLGMMGIILVVIIASVKRSAKKKAKQMAKVVAPEQL